MSDEGDCPPVLDNSPARSKKGVQGMPVSVEEAQRDALLLDCRYQMRYPRGGTIEVARNHAPETNLLGRRADVLFEL